MNLGGISNLISMPVIGKYRASFNIVPPVVLAGAMPRRQQNLIIAWAELHQEELMENWQRVKLEEPLRKIEGLK